MLKWIALILCIAAVVGVMLLPAVACGNWGSANDAVNANNMKEIVKVIILHREKTKQVLPNPWEAAGVEFPVVINGTQAMMVTAAIFEYLASVNDCPPDLFVNPWYESTFSYSSSRRSAHEIVTHPDIRYAEFY
ncbi:MAG: hypothetical protein HRU15_11215, partial [Planctomycetes bacterium]|nr:hypothetical protein [Planctomycetota bacterium]